jgi:hypothetical protein
MQHNKSESSSVPVSTVIVSWVVCVAFLVHN